ncbi:MAG TPA: hypothetical protein VMZ28_11560 [Kofleriaceae bacterium]|nr:hypothetical protein [Kofleriaceae bacterium]
MTKRIVVYVSAILVALTVWILLSDRMVTDRVPALEHGVVRFVVAFAVLILLGRALRPLVNPRRDRA